jgi:predicted kinase
MLVRRSLSGPDRPPSFRSPAVSARLYPRLMQRGRSHLASREVVCDSWRRPDERVGIKHRLNRNSIRVCDKQCSVLQV